MEKCVKCAAELPEGAKYCPYCGKKQVTEEKRKHGRKDNFYTVYYETLERAGCRHLTPYSCRHTTATTLALENIPPAVLQKIMRHAKYSTTEKYIHIDIDPMLEAVNKLKQNKTSEQ